MNFVKNWKTSLTGAAAIATAVGHLLTQLGLGDFSSIVPDITAIMAGLGLLFAKDQNVTGGTVRQ